MRQLERYAQRPWLERATQEVDGTITTPIWDSNILNLHNGDRITIRVRPDLEAEPHDDLWYVRTVTHEWPSKKATTIGFINLLRI